MDTPYQAAPDIHVLPSYVAIPVYGMVPVNAFVIKAKEPVLVDTGSVLESPEFMKTLCSVIDPQDLKWIWLTHTDFDHIGSLRQLLEEVPQIRVITTFLGVGIMSLAHPLPLDRVYLLNPGESLDVGDRTLTAFKPPIFDNPATTGFYDRKAEALFSSDFLGAIMSTPAQNAGDVSEKALREGQIFWATADSPWLHHVDEGKFAKALNRIREMSPKLILSSHLPMAQGMTEQLLAAVSEAPRAQPFVGPNQPALQEMLVQMTGALS